MNREWLTSDDGSEPVVEIGCDGCSRVTTLTGDDLLALVGELHEKTAALSPPEEPAHGGDS